jgi:hypothetical protein
VTAVGDTERWFPSMERLERVWNKPENPPQSPHGKRY